MDPIKEAFARAKQDIEELRAHIIYLNSQLEEIKRTLQQTDIPTHSPTHPSENPTLQQIIPTDLPIHSNTPTDNLPLYGLKTPFSEVSSGNRGVPTDRQTDRQTDQQTVSNQQIRAEAPKTAPPRTPIQQVSEMLSSLDSLKHELKRQFKSLTAKEMQVYATIYQLEEERNAVDYPLLADRLHLSESSIRDYTLKLIKKGVPLMKIKHDNKKITLSIPLELKKMASLQALLALHEQESIRYTD